MDRARAPLSPAGGQRPVAVLVAPNDFEGPAVNLGAATKLAAVARILHGLGYAVHYVDSSHWRPRLAPAVQGRPSRIEDTPVALWRPFMLPNRKLGKMLNALLTGSLHAAMRPLQPALVWVWNSYAFEAALAMRFRRDGVPVVLELEDLPLARSRGLNPKEYWDRSWFHRLLREAALVTFVNAALMQRFGPLARRSLLLPSILRPQWAAAAGRPRFVGQRRMLGYFGGLSAEKGAAILLQALPMLPADWELVVTGVGPLAEEFERAAQSHPQRLRYHGAVDPEALHRLMLGCDVIVNPHAPISEMADGVFPFKVCESIASGALLLSTALPDLGQRLDDAVLFYDGSAQGLVDGLLRAPAFAAEHAACIDDLAQRVRLEYGQVGVSARVARLLAGFAHAPQPAREHSAEQWV